MCTPRACRCRLTVPRIFSPSPCSSCKCRNLHTVVSSGAGSCLNRSPRTALSPASHAGLFHRRVRQIEPLLQEIHTQHSFHSHRWPPVPRFPIVWLNQRTQLAPRDNLLHLFQKHLSSCLFCVLSKPFIVARVLCCLFVNFIWRQLTLYCSGKGDLIQSLPRSSGAYRLFSRSAGRIGRHARNPARFVSAHLAIRKKSGCGSS
jgi:hypothetical protein